MPENDTSRICEGLALLNSAHYFHAHEVLEDVWRAAAPTDRQFFQGLIQVAVALHHHSRGNLAGCKSLLTRAGRNLSGYPDGHLGLDLNSLRRSLAEWQQALDQGVALPSPPTVRLRG